MIYIDGIGHLVSDTSLDELHAFARKLGLKLSWFQDKTPHPHYDCTTNRMRQKAIEAGAEWVTSREIVAMSKALQIKETEK